MQTLPVGEERQWRRQINWSASALWPKTTRTYQSNVKGRISTTSWLLPEGSFLFAAHTFTVAINFILWICFQTGVCYRMTQDYQVVYAIFIDFGTLSSIFFSNNWEQPNPHRPQVKTAGTRNINPGRKTCQFCLRPCGPVSMPGKCLFQASASFPPQIPQPWRGWGCHQLQFVCVKMRCGYFLDLFPREHDVSFVRT